MNFKDKVVWITGASSGIGEALAEEFAQLGARLILSSRRQAELERVKAKLKMSNDDCLVLPLDLEQYQEMEGKVEKALLHFDRIDYLVNNGGISQRSLILDTKMEVYKRLMDIDYLGTVALSKAVLPVFVNQKSAQENGMSPNECAQNIIAAINRGNYEAYIGGKERLAVYLKRWFPRLLHRVVRKSAVT